MKSSAAIPMPSPAECRANSPSTTAAVRVCVREPAANVAHGVDVAHYVGFVRRIARRMARKLPSHVPFDDLVGSGLVGLVDAARRYDPEKAGRFETFAEFRIKGAILDELRKHDMLARKARMSAKRVAATTQKLTAQLGRPPTEEEVAAALDLSLSQYQRLLARVGTLRVLSLSESSSCDPQSSNGVLELPSALPRPDEIAFKRDQLRSLERALTRLPSRQRRILDLYYRRELTLRQIGLEFGVSESRICQIIRDSTKKLRVWMSAHHSDTPQPRRASGS